MRYVTLLPLLTVTGLVGCNAITSKSKTDPLASKYAITNVSLVDVENGIVLPSQTVIVVDDRIEKIGAHGKVDIPCWHC